MPSLFYTGPPHLIYKRKKELKQIGAKLLITYFQK